ncbi:LOW QUALITY PROTEIN: hypothetical protein KIPB_010301, partial [Kipferlia bialata]
YVFLYAVMVTRRVTLHGREWYIQPTVATKGTGLYGGLDWLAKQLKANRRLRA